MARYIDPKGKETYYPFKFGDIIRLKGVPGPDMIVYGIDEDKVDVLYYDINNVEREQRYATETFPLFKVVGSVL